MKIHPGEERAAALLAGLFLCAAAGGAIGGNATEALFFDRFGVSRLPVMYILLGLVSFASALAVTAWMGRVSKQRLYARLPLWLAGLLVIERVGAMTSLGGYFAGMWLVMNIISSLVSLQTWGLAGLACDTRQARRLFPLFSAGSILGTVLGGLVTPPLAAWLHAENLLLVWAALLLAVYALARGLTGQTAPAPAAAGEPQPGIWDEMQIGYRFVRRSPILRWISYSAVLFSVCFFSLALPFSRGAAAQFPGADRLAGFLGLFQSLSTITALLASLLLANRVFARFGIMPALLALPVIYLAGFAALAASAGLLLSAPFALLVAFRFTQSAYMNGVAETAWQAAFNVAPPDLRDQVRAFVNGAPSQAGTLIAGLVLFVGEQALAPQALYGIGFAASAGLVYMIWRASRAYSQALVDALRAGRPQVFHAGLSLAGVGMDAAALAVVLAGLNDPHPAARQAAAEIAGSFTGGEVVRALTGALADTDAGVRAAALKGLGQVGAASALPEVTACLNDPEPAVRCQAIAVLDRLEAPPGDAALALEPLLEDADTRVRARAARALLRRPPAARAFETLRAMLADPDPPVRARALEALGSGAGRAGLALSLPALEDPHPLVRAAAARALAGMPAPAAVESLAGHLGDADGLARRAVGEALASAGAPALPHLLDALADPAREDGALHALSLLADVPAQMHARLREHARAAAQSALHYHALTCAARGSLPDPTGGEAVPAGATGGSTTHHHREQAARLLVESLESESRRRAVNALRALSLVTARAALTTAVEHLRYPAQRANALETLESAGEREIIRPLLALWEAGSPPPAPPADWLLGLLGDPSPWLRACAALAAGNDPDPRVAGRLREMCAGDPDDLVRETAALSQPDLSGETPMETLATLSVMERILFLRRVPLFADLPPEDLQQIAQITSEALFLDGQVLARQGDPGSVMYILVSGEVRVVTQDERGQSAREVALRRTGDTVGEMAIIDRQPRMASLVAAGPVRALCLKQAEFEVILRERPEISLAMLRTLSRRVREAGER